MSARALPSDAPVQPVPTAVQAVADYFYQIWRRRYFWWSLVKIDLRTRYRGTYLGLGWSLLNPILMTMVMCLVFAKLFRQPLATYAPFVLSGLAFWNYLTGIVMDGCHSFRRGEAYIRQHPAPLAIYPLKASLVVGIHFLMALVVLLGTVWLARGTVPWHALWLLVPALGLYAVLGWTTAIVMGVVNVWFEDTAQLSHGRLPGRAACSRAARTARLALRLRFSGRRGSGHDRAGRLAAVEGGTQADFLPVA